MLDRNFHCVDKVYFGDLNAPGVKHSGDEREGDEKGDDEKIHVDLARVAPNVMYLGFVVNSYSGEPLSQVKDVGCRMYNSAVGPGRGTVASYDCSQMRRLGRATALVMCVLYRKRPGDDFWYMHAIGEPAMGRTADDNIDELQAFLRKTPIFAHMSYSAPPPPPQPIAVAVPATARVGQVLAVQTPTAHVLQVVVPPGAPGRAIQVTAPIEYRC